MEWVIGMHANGKKWVDFTGRDNDSCCWCVVFSFSCCFRSLSHPIPEKRSPLSPWLSFHIIIIILCEYTSISIAKENHFMNINTCNHILTKNSGTYHSTKQDHSNAKNKTSLKKSSLLCPVLWWYIRGLCPIYWTPERIRKKHSICLVCPKSHPLFLLMCPFILTQCRCRDDSHPSWHNITFSSVHYNFFQLSPYIFIMWMGKSFWNSDNKSDSDGGNIKPWLKLYSDCV